MADPKIPEKYAPRNPDPEVEVSVSPAAKSEIDNPTAVAQSTGLIQVESRMLRTFEQIGVKFDGAGAIRAANGALLLTMDQIGSVMESIGELAKKGEQVHKCATSVGYLATALAKCAKELKSAGHVGKKESRGNKRVSGFIPGAPVQVAITNVIQKEIPAVT